MSRRPDRNGRRTALAVLAAACGVLGLGGCSTLKSIGSPSAPAARPPSVGAQLRPVGGSAFQGSAAFARRGDGVVMIVALNGFAPGRYRVMVHERGNCSSPNGFSAGPPWPGPGGAAAPMVRDVPIVTTNSEGTGSLTVFLAGVGLDGPKGVMGRSVVVHDGALGPLDAKPDVPNERIACGVIGVTETLF